MKAIDRVYQYIDLKGIKVVDFERGSSISNGYLSKMKQRSAGMGEDILNQILENCPDICPEWLLTGNGPMLKDDSSPDVQLIHNPPYREAHDDLTVPLYNIDAAANLLTIFENKHQNIIDTIRIPDMPRCDGAISVRGDSMYPLLKSGDIVIYKEIYDFNLVVYGEMYLVDFTLNDDDFLVVKYVNKSDRDRCIRLVSYNQHHDPMDIEVSCIRAMALVKASIRFNTMF